MFLTWLTYVLEGFVGLFLWEKVVLILWERVASLLFSDEKRDQRMKEKGWKEEK